MDEPDPRVVARWDELTPGFEHMQYHGASGGGPDPDCHLCRPPQTSHDEEPTPRDAGPNSQPSG